MVMAEPLATSIWAHARWMVLAPHPDDETLGAGALIRHAAATGDLCTVIYLTDGSGSHPPGTPGLSSARRREAQRAVRRLSARATPIGWMGWKDANPHEPRSRSFARDAQRLAAMLRHHGIDALAVTDPSESHCDHVAAFNLAKAAVRLAHRPVALFSYHVWSGDSGRATRRIRTRPLDRGIRRNALQAHRSQLTPAYGEGFRLPRALQRMARFDTLTLQDD